MKRLIGIVGATGSIEAVSTVLGMLPHDFPAPILGS
jgi:hypothetical protein